MKGRTKAKLMLEELWWTSHGWQVYIGLKKYVSLKNLLRDEMGKVDEPRYFDEYTKCLSKLYCHPLV